MLIIVIRENEILIFLWSLNRALPPPCTTLRVVKGFSLTHDRSQIISVMCDRAQLSRVRRDWA